MNANSGLTLHNGVHMPFATFGTWRIPKDLTKQAVVAALEAGYRSIDCAAIYGNEAEVGEAFKEVFSSGKVKREDVFITSKLWNTCHKREHVSQELQQTLKDLQLEYLDLYLIHWPLAFEFTTIDLKPGVPKDENGKIKFGKVTLQETWQAMEDLLESGKVRAIGVSNWNALLLQDLLSFAKVPPMINQIEIHPYNNRRALVDYCRSRGINVSAYSALGSGKEGPKEDPKIADIAKKHNKSPAQVLLRWSAQCGHTVISKSNSKERVLENLNIFDFELSQDEMKQIDALDKKFVVCNPSDDWGLPISQ